MAGENYIGSKISLISLSDIRYVGILHSINAQDSTVGLKQVRSFGTEGRRGKPEEEILPSDNVFDYVVFRGSDIKDLQVFEAPPKPTPPPPPPSMPQDPAIMSMNAYPPPPMNHPYMNSNMYMQPPVQQPKQQQPLNHPPVTSQTPTPTAPMSNNNNNNNNSSSYWQPSPGSTFAAERDLDQARLEKETLDELKAELEESSTLQPSINEAAIEQLAKKVSELNPNEDTVISSKPMDDQQQSRRRYDNHHQNNNYRNHRGGRFNHPNHHKAKHDLAIPSSEFDFEASNAKFDKSEIVKKDDGEHEHEEIEIPKPDEFYNKTSSFFDNISCESKERIEQQQEQQQEQHHQGDTRRSRFHEERKLNMETFGQATVEQTKYRNNYNRGRGYRGNRGGGGNYYRNNNRNNYNNNSNYNNNNNNNNNYNNNNFRQNKSQNQQETI